MLKRYYQLTEAAEFLSKKEGTTISTRDILDLAARGEVRACFWLNDFLTNSRDENLFAMPIVAMPTEERTTISIQEQDVIQDFQDTIDLLTSSRDEDMFAMPDEYLHSFLSFRGYVQVPAQSISPNGEVLPFDGITQDLIIECTGLIYACDVGENYMSLCTVDKDTFRVIRKEFQVVTSNILIPAEDLLAISFKGADKERPQQNLNKSDGLAYLNQAANKFWANADKEDKTTHPTNAVVSKWLHEDRGLSERLADSGASIIRPTWAAVGRKPEK